MLQYLNLLLVGGTARNVGKTECICRIINKFTNCEKVYALKLSAIFPDEEMFHGDHSEDTAAYQLFEETRLGSKKDTSRMLKAGAKRVFYLRCNDNYIPQGFTAFMQNIPENAAIVCESNSLGNYVQPGLIVMLQSAEGPIKARAKAQMERADLLVFSDGHSGFPGLERIVFHGDHGWQLKG